MSALTDPSTITGAGRGAAGGALVGALATLFSSNPGLGSLVKNTLIGAATGGIVGGGVGAATRGKGPGPPVVDAEVVGEPRKMNLPLAALSGLAPGIGPGLHGGMSGGVGQGVASGLASITAGTAAAHPLMARAPGKATALGVGASALAALGAGAIGNKIRG